jgi:AcrR family transcriptional regulator
MVGPNSAWAASVTAMTGSGDAVTATKPGAGRPRDSSMDGAILQVVRELLVERGYQALTIQEVTRRCGVHVRTVTRRWSSKAVLVAAAILERDDPTLSARDASITTTGRLAADIRGLIASGLEFLGQPATQAAYPALISEMRTNAEVREQFELRTRDWRDSIEAVLAHAVATGDAPPGIIGRGRLLPHILGGTAFNLQWGDPTAIDDDLIDEFTDFVLGALLAQDDG